MLSKGFHSMAQPGDSTHLRLEITVYNSLLPHDIQGCQQLMGESPNQGRAESNEAVRLDQLVEVDAQEFGDDAKMTTEEEIIRNLDKVMLVLGIL
jgi:hypothetical protein